MEAKLCALKKLSANISVRSKLPKPVLIRTSGRDMARRRARADRKLWRMRIKGRRERLFQGIHVVLQAVTGDEGLHRPFALDIARGPGQLDADQLHVAGVTPADRSAGDGGRSAVNRTLIPRTAGRIIIIREPGRYEAGLTDLVPVVKPDGFQFLLEDLCGSEIFAGDLHEGEALGDCQIQRDGYHSQQSGPNQHLDQGEGTSRDGHS